MLPKHFRLTYDRDFDTLWKEGKFVNGALVTMKYWKIDSAKYPRRAYAADDLRIAFVVGLKVSKRAVDRNRLKRQMREAVRLMLKDSRVKRGYLMAFVAKSGMVGKEYREIEEEMIRVLKRAQLFG